MSGNNSETDESVTVSVELTGEYTDVIPKLADDGERKETLLPVTDDLRRILTTVARIDGGTRSAVATNLPAEMTSEYDPEAVVTALKLLERYELVTLDGNTWYPDAAVETGQTES